MNRFINRLLVKSYLTYILEALLHFFALPFEIPQVVLTEQLDINITMINKIKNVLTVFVPSLVKLV